MPFVCPSVGSLNASPAAGLRRPSCQVSSRCLQWAGWRSSPSTPGPGTEAGPEEGGRAPRKTWIFGRSHMLLRRIIMDVKTDSSRLRNAALRLHHGINYVCTFKTNVNHSFKTVRLCRMGDMEEIFCFSDVLVWLGVILFMSVWVFVLLFVCFLHTACGSMVVWCHLHFCKSFSMLTCLN